MTDTTIINKIIKFYGLDKLNSLTKYPSILTYHETAERGSLAPVLVENKDFSNYEKIYLTEKIDGTNTRIVFITNDNGTPCDFLIGSREDFLHAKGDRIINPALGIVDTVYKEVINGCLSLASISTFSTMFKPNHLYVIYGETYGGKINGAKQYTNIQAYNFRAFDIIEMDLPSAYGILSMKLEDISAWREHGGQPFISVEKLIYICDCFSLNRVPYIKTINGTELPTTIKETFNWLQEFIKSTATIEPEYSGTAKAEGVVVRTKDRKLIRKIRFEDYEKTQRIHPEYFN